MRGQGRAGPPSSGKHLHREHCNGESGPLTGAPTRSPNVTQGLVRRWWEGRKWDKSQKNKRSNRLGKEQSDFLLLRFLGGGE